MPKLAQSISWDPSSFVGFTTEQLEMIHRGFRFALNEVYRRETAVPQERMGHVEMADPEDMARDLEEARAASRVELDAAFDAGCEDGAFTPERWCEGRARAAYVDGWNRSNPDDQRR